MGARVSVIAIVIIIIYVPECYLLVGRGAQLAADVDSMGLLARTLGTSSKVFATHPLTHSFMETLTRGPTRTPSATFNSPLPLPFSGATSACSSDAHCGEQAHAVEVHTLVGYPELEPNG